MMSRPDPAPQEVVDLVNHPLSTSRDSLSGRPVPEVLAEIESGGFAQSWMEEYRSGKAQMQALREEEKGLEIERVGRDLRLRMRT